MALVTENVKKNSQKCQECILKTTKDKAYEAKMALEGIMMVSCNVCPNKKDFETVYGTPPYVYFSDPKNSAALYS